jgi:hypothetical protein
MIWAAGEPGSGSGVPCDGNVGVGGRESVKPQKAIAAGARSEAFAPNGWDVKAEFLLTVSVEAGAIRVLDPMQKCWFPRYRTAVTPTRSEDAAAPAIGGRIARRVADAVGARC